MGGIMSDTVIFKKRTGECALWKEEVYFNMNPRKMVFNSFQLHHIACIHCRKGEEISFALMGGRYWSFCISTAEKSHISVKKGKKVYLNDSNLLIRPPIIQQEDEVAVMGHHILESTVQKECKRYYFGIERNIYMEQMFCLGEVKVIHLRNPEKVINCIESLLTLVQGKKACSSIEISCLLFRFLSLINPGDFSRSVSTGPYSHLIDFVRHYPQDYPALESMEKTFQVSRETLRKIFLEHTSMSPMDFVVKARLKNSCWMLTNSVMPIREIAELNGYKDAAFYSHAFKKHYGISPKQYREQAEKKK